MRRIHLPPIVVIGILFYLGGRMLLHPGLPAPESAARVAVVWATLGGGGGAAAEAGRGSTAVEAVRVNVEALPAGVDLDTTPYARWLRGEADLEMEPVPPTAPPAPSTNITAPRPVDGENADDFSLLRTFEGPNFGNSGSMPADPVLAVGLRHVLAAVNGAFEIYDKSGQLLLETRSISAFFDQPGLLPGCAIHPFDPDLLYDEAADRFILLTAGASAGLGDTLCVAASAGPDPTGVWHLYTFDAAPNGSFFDFPQAGIGRDALYVGANNIGVDGGPGQVWAFEKESLYAGDVVEPVTRVLGEELTLPTPNPVHLTGLRQMGWPAHGPHYFVAHHYDAVSYDLFAWDDPFGANTWTHVGTFDLGAATAVDAGFPVASVQLSGESLAGNDSRLWDVDYRDGSLWLTMHVSCNPGADVVNCVRWARVDPETAAVENAGVLGSAAQHRFFPALAVNHCGDLLLGYSVSSEGMYPAYAVTGIRGAGGDGAPPQEMTVMQSETPYEALGPIPHRWGDYSGLVVDPDGLTLWSIGPFAADTDEAAAANWHTVIGAYAFADCDAPATHDLFLPLLMGGG